MASKIAIRDAISGNNIPIVAYDDPSGNTAAAHVLLTGAPLAPVGQSNPLQVAGTLNAVVTSLPALPAGGNVVGAVLQAGATPADFSGNAPSVPSGYSLLTTVPATAGRATIEVQNQSGSQLMVVRDDGSSSSGTVSTILLAGAGPGLQGNGWSSQTFKGRVRIYGPSGSQYAAFQE